MASRKRCLQSQQAVNHMLKLIPEPQSPQDVLLLLKLAAQAAPAKPGIAAHLAEVGALFPDELMGAFRAFLKRQTSDN